PPPSPPLFPYTTLFRSAHLAGNGLHRAEIGGRAVREASLDHVHAEVGQGVGEGDLLRGAHGEAGRLFAVAQGGVEDDDAIGGSVDRKSTRLNSSHVKIS